MIFHLVNCNLMLLSFSVGIYISKRTQSTDNRIEVFVNDKSVWVEPGNQNSRVSRVDIPHLRHANFITDYDVCRLCVKCSAAFY